MNCIIFQKNYNIKEDINTCVMIYYLIKIISILKLKYITKYKKDIYHLFKTD